ncbi:PHA/PHB synthase family protein [Nioella sediminis]|jgi:polyhydroxyalkanoate synthase|uniref:PHA/PHB synthase family protein n=1 Tax=Nioella sediminis TaxID=1912092 RepID=UPI0008FD7B23
MAQHADGGDSDMGDNLERLNANLAKMEELSKRMVAALGQKDLTTDAGMSGPGQDLYVKAGSALFNEMLTNPTKLMGHQVAYWSKAVENFIETQQALAAGQFEMPEDDDAPKDKRFANPMWRTHPYFRFVRKQYELNSDAIEQSMAELEGLTPKEKSRVEFFSRQIIDLFAPTNYLATNPDALQKAIDTDGQSLVDGLENLVRDIEANKGELLPTLSDPNAFKVGENIGTAEGKVVFRNRMMEVIQYAPKTDTVYRTPLVIFPPWINKFYIMDLKPQNSLIRWIVEQGYTLFVVSWVNPDASYAEVGLEDYIEEGYLQAVEVAKEITGEKQVNAVGYCIAGTTLSATLALLQKRGDKSIKSATFFTTLTDFSDQGEFTVFLQDDFVDAIERQVTEKGILDSFFMSKTMSFLRSNDLVYGPAVRSYMMGEAPPAFDLLYWNGDSTNLPGRMVKQYLRQLCQGNELAEGGFKILGETVSIRDIKLPVCSVGTKTDHIAPWKNCYRGFSQFGSRDKTFIMSESGHIAGIINPPSKKKYGHFLNPKVKGTADEWLEGAEFHEGSWWPVWEEWLQRRSGAQVSAREPGESGHETLGDAPGTYVLVTTKG